MEFMGNCERYEVKTGAWKDRLTRTRSGFAICAVVLSGVAALPQVGEAVTPKDPPPRRQWTATASGVQTKEFVAENAIDGQPHTRWSSPFSDPQWLKIDMGEVATLCGFMIRWEAAYSSHYLIEVSLDGETWEKVYEDIQGDGRTDYIFIKPSAARYFRITGLARATGWGHSIYEVEAWGPSRQPSITAPGDDLERLMDGDMETIWRADTTPARIEIDLRRVMHFGSVRIDWGEEYATHFGLDVSRDGEEWTSTPGIEGGRGAFDFAPMDPVEARYIRIDLAATVTGEPAEIRQISLRGPDEELTPLLEYQMAARKSEIGRYPEHLHGRQTYWTIVGLPKDRQVSLIDEYGNMEPFVGGSTLMPYIWMDGELYSALDTEERIQYMEDGFLPLPVVQWTFPDWTLKAEAITCGTVRDSVTYVRYTLKNRSEDVQSGRVFLAIRPVQINPPWQHGGMSPISRLEYVERDDHFSARVNRNYSYVSLMRPDAFGVQRFHFGDIVHDLETGSVPDVTRLANQGGLLSGAFAYDYEIGPDESFSVIMAIPLHDDDRHLKEFLMMSRELPGGSSSAYDVHRESMRQFWKARLGDVEMDMPDQELVNTVRAQIAYILINMAGDAIQPGARNYNRTWIRDGSITAAALMRMGLIEDARVYLEWYAQAVEDDGLVPPILNHDGTVYLGWGSNFEYDSQGQFVYIMTEYHRMTGDDAFLERHFDAIVRALEFQQRLREETLVPGYMNHEPPTDRFVGILPKSISHEGYDPPRHSYWDNFWALRGWQDGAYAARLFGREDIEEWALEQYDVLKEAVIKTLEATVEFKDIDFIPGASDLGDFDATSTAIAFEPCRVAHILDQELLHNTFDMYFGHLKKRFDPGWDGQYTPYEARSLQALVELGYPDRAKVLLESLLSHRRPLGWNHLGEVVLGGYRVGGYIGDMPHTWVGSDLVNSVRGMLVLEYDEIIRLLSGITESWFENNGPIRLKNWPTHFGAIDLVVEYKDDRMNMDWGGTVNPPEGYKVFWPNRRAPASVKIDGEPWEDFNEQTCRVPAGTRTLVAEW